MKSIRNITEKSRLKTLVTLLFLTACVVATSHIFCLPAASARIATPDSFSSLAENVSQSVVNISTVKTIKGGGPVFRNFYRGPSGKDDPFQDFFEKFFGKERQREFKQKSLGSGFIFDKEGYIITNNHVIEGADQIKVKLNNEKEFDAKIIGRDPSTDIAVIKIKSAHNLPVVTLGDSDAMKVGEWVIAIGSPFGLEHTVTAGIISAKGRVIGSGPYDDFIQTDASINPGNSGGPLINMNGEVIGINTAIVAGGQGIGFAIPINVAKGIVEQLIKSGEVTRGWIGVAIQSLSEELAEYYGIKKGQGVLVTEVFSGDPADKAGIQPKDIIIEINGKEVGKSRTLSRVVADIKVGTTAKIKVLRNGRKKTFNVRVTERENAKTVSRDDPNGHEAELGIHVSELTAERARRFRISKAEGIIVTHVDRQSKAAEAGVLSGDIIKEINHKAIKTSKDYNSVLEDIKKGEPVIMVIKRRDTGFLIIRLTK
ncbi:MAG: DegQ family serine endoprotease [Deltaproteobacteria bacterium]|nr:DegQ family serine endoprotease [Deltaproteobacteria bacterium]MBW2011466.1 DegQ family serine endoprotease [Deltaproteobacteria bacterium]